MYYDILSFFLVLVISDDALSHHMLGSVERDSSHEARQKIHCMPILDYDHLSIVGIFLHREIYQTCFRIPTMGWTRPHKDHF